MKTRRDILKSLAVLPALGVPALAASKERGHNPSLPPGTINVQEILDAFVPRDGSPPQLIRHEIDAVQKHWKLVDEYRDVAMTADDPRLQDTHRLVDVDMREVRIEGAPVELPGSRIDGGHIVSCLGHVLDVEHKGDKLVLSHLVEVNDDTRRFLTYYNMGLPFEADVVLLPVCLESAGHVWLRPTWTLKSTLRCD